MLDNAALITDGLTCLNFGNSSSWETAASDEGDDDEVQCGGTDEGKKRTLARTKGTQWEGASDAARRSESHVGCAGDDSGSTEGLSMSTSSGGRSSPRGCEGTRRTSDAPSPGESCPNEPVAPETEGKGCSVSEDGGPVTDLEELVRAEDWDGVALAAAKLEASVVEGQDFGCDGSSQETSTDDETLTTLATNDYYDMYSQTDERDYDDDDGVEENSAADCAVVATTPSEEELAKRNEVKAEVKALVRLVLPHEIDNVDVMMGHYEGREDELLRSLRTMQERSVTQRARAAVHKGEGGAAAGEDVITFQ